ncbi:MAG: hypothetical protein U0795_09550 [Pirellulales bacterium]
MRYCQLHASPLSRLIVLCLALGWAWSLGGCRRSESDGKAKAKQTDEEALENRLGAKKKKDDQKKADDAEKDEKELPPFARTELHSVPFDATDAKNPRNYYKPGHWTAVQGRWRANHEDYAGQLRAMPVSASGQPMPLESSFNYLVTSRPVSLPKGQDKLVETTAYFPITARDRIGSLDLTLAQTGGLTNWSSNAVAVSMLPHQYFFVILSNQPNQLGYIRQLPSMNPPGRMEGPNTSIGLVADTTADSGEGFFRDYVVVAPAPAGRTIALPTTSTCWTTIAYLVWDGFDPTILTATQQEALLDWLHWGGQLIIANPRSLDTLKGSFLEGYLPATIGSARPLSDGDLTELNSWAERVRSEKRPMRLVPSPASKLERYELAAKGEGRPVAGSGQLVWERPTGRGRVLVTAFSLAEIDTAFKNWPGFDSFWNAFILGHPGRNFYVNQDQAAVSWNGLSQSADDPRFTTGVRYFARDVDAVMVNDPDAEPTLAERQFDVAGYSPHPQAGIGGWNETNGCAELARGMLNVASGIDVPDRSFVAALLLGYLVILVPLNWAVFRLLGRVEWAWMMTPVLALAGTAAVIRLAQLDIGFVRSQTELAVVELHGAYPRAHVARYTGLYTSLATAYRLDFPGLNAIAKSFWLDETPSDFDRAQELVLARGRDTELTGIRVASNSTGLFHSEEFIGLPGGIHIQSTGPLRYLLRNESGLNVRDVLIVGRDESDRVVWTEFDSLADQASLPIVLRPYEGDERPQPKFSVPARVGDLDLNPLLQLAAHPSRLRPGQLTLVGWTDQSVGGLQISPAASQRLFRTMIISHLQRGTAADPEPDTNLLSDVTTALDQQLESSLEGLQ